MKNNILFTVLVAACLFTACKSNDNWSVKGCAENAPETTLLVQASDNGRWFTLDSVKTDSEGNFQYSRDKALYPDIYRITVDGKSVYFPIDSTETVTVNFNADDVDGTYDISGSTAADMLMAVALRIRQIANEKGVDAVAGDSLLKRELGGMIIGDPAGIVSYYIINKQVNGNRLFNPVNRSDNRIIGAVANAYTQFRPNDPRTKYLRAIFLANRPLSTKNTSGDTIQATEIKYFDIDLMDHKGISHKLSEAVNDNKVVILSFTIYQADGSTPYNVALADAYSKYRDNGLEIYQVALDNDEFQWKQSAKNLPWITVYNPPTANASTLQCYNVRTLPTTYIIANGELAERVTDMSKLNSAVASYL